MSALRCSSELSLGAVSAAGRGGLAAPGRGDLAAPGRGGLAAPGRGDLATPGRRDLVAPGREGLAAPGRGDLVAPGRGSMAAPGRGDLVAPGREGLASLGRESLLAAGRDVNIKVECKAIHTQLTILLFLPSMSKVDCLLFFNGMTTFGQKLTSHGLFRSRGTKGIKSSRSACQQTCSAIYIVVQCVPVLLMSISSLAQSFKNKVVVEH